MTTQQPVVRTTRISLEDAQAQYENMKWPEVRKQIEAQTSEIIADVEMRQSLSMKDHMA